MKWVNEQPSKTKTYRESRGCIDIDQLHVVLFTSWIIHIESSVSFIECIESKELITKFMNKKPAAEHSTQNGNIMKRPGCMERISKFSQSLAASVLLAARLSHPTVAAVPGRSQQLSWSTVNPFVYYITFCSRVKLTEKKTDTQDRTTEKEKTFFSLSNFGFGYC